MKLRFLALLLAGLAAVAARADTPADVLVLVGAPGEDSYTDVFKKAADSWQAAAQKAGANFTVIGLDKPADGAPTDLDQFRAWVQKLDPVSPAPVWIAYIGHGTFDGKDSRMNLRGPDISANQTAALLKNVTRPLIFVNGAAGSAQFIGTLSGPNRVVITATQNPNEVNYARFGEKFAEAINDPTADVDQDGEVSLLEAFVVAAQRTQAFYDEDGRLATEHPLLDDNGDKRGTPASWYNGTRLVQRPQGNFVPDGSRAKYIVLVPSAEQRALTPEQVAMRDNYERQLDQLRANKSKMVEADYYAQLETLLRYLGAVYLHPPATAPATPPGS